MTQSLQPTASIQHQIKIKGSRFIADILPVKTEEDVQEKLEEIRKREYNANHHCFAWRLGVGDDEIWRISDDGEPSGTAGKPIYQVLLGNHITNVLAVVTRYFGGIKLGKGGLIRAYGGVVQEALPLLKTVVFVSKVRMSCHCDFEHANLVYRLIDTHHAELVEQVYSKDVHITWKIDRKKADAFAWELFELSQGTIRAEIEA